MKLRQTETKGGKGVDGHWYGWRTSWVPFFGRRLFVRREKACGHAGPGACW